MTVSLEKVPRTPAQVARAVLDNIAANPDSFDMAEWTSLEPGEELPPDASLSGVTLCAASWVARVTGWTLVHDYEDVVVYDRWGAEDDEVRLYAERDGERRLIADVAEEALALDRWGGTFWTSTESAAQGYLREIAGWE